MKTTNSDNQTKTAGADFIFPFGQPLHKVVQRDHSPKKVFILGVYASAVHARCIDKDGNQMVAALAVASEPEIFWTGHDAQKQIDKIEIPAELGKLVLPGSNLNGPSGKALDELYLKPLGLNRTDVWLCDLIPETRINPNQKNAINRYYNPIREKYNLPEVTIPEFQHSELNSTERRNEILAELFTSQAETLILLGDLPIKHFLNYFVDKKYDGLGSFGIDSDSYGNSHKISISGKVINIIALCHPRQAQRLGASNARWFELHKKWVNENLLNLKNLTTNEKQIVVRKPQTCPVCGSKKIASYMYGMPAFSVTLEEKIKDGKIILGGCCISDHDPDYACLECKTDFYKSVNFL